MASRDLDRVSRALNHRSEPVQIPQEWTMASPNELHTRIRSMCEVTSPLDYDADKHHRMALQISRSSSSPSLPTPENPEKISTRFSKIELDVDALSVASSEQSVGILQHRWRPSYLRLGPLIGIIALVLAFLQIFASYAILSASNGRATVDWEFSPSVYIAVLTALSNGAISFAAVKGAVVTFWLRCLQGTTLGQLHRDWAYSFEAYNAIRSGRNINLLALSCIFATLVCIDGPLLQRAASTQITNSQNPVRLNVSLAPEIPSYFSGSYSPAENAAQFSNEMLPIMSAYSSGAPITASIHGCEGSCHATIRAPALIAHHCDTHMTSQNFSAPYTPYETSTYRQGLFPVSRTLFWTYLSSSFGNSETLDFQTYLTGNGIAENCAGRINSTHCYLRSAIAEYNVDITNNTITLKDTANPKFVSWANNTAINNASIHSFNLREDQPAGWTKTTLAAIINAFSYQYSFSGTAYPPKHSKPGILDISVQSQSLFMYQHITNYAAYNNQTACTYAWDDPRPATMAGLNELMFRIGVYVGQHYSPQDLAPLLDPGLETNYTVTGILHGPQEVFKSDFAYFFAAAALELLAIILVASTFFGYWRLGRHVSFSPLEIAKAFDAPLLANVGSNATGRQSALLKDAEEVRYGTVYGGVGGYDASQSTSTLKLSHPGNVHEAGLHGLNEPA